MKRAVLAVSGLGVLAAAWLGPLSALASAPFAGHMLMHMGVVALAAPLIALAVAGTALDPVPRAPVLFEPIAASVFELFAVWAWHAPALHHFARHSTAGLVLEQGSFLISGLWLWLAALGGDAREGGARAGAGVLALLLTTMHMTLLGALLALANRPLYAHAMEGVGLGPLEDQHLGGAIMLLAGGTAYLLGGLALGAAILRRRVAPASSGGVR